MKPSKKTLKQARRAAGTFFASLIWKKRVQRSLHNAIQPPGLYTYSRGFQGFSHWYGNCVYKKRSGSYHFFVPP